VQDDVDGVDGVGHLLFFVRIAICWDNQSLFFIYQDHAVCYRIESQWKDGVFVVSRSLEINSIKNRAGQICLAERRRMQDVVVRDIGSREVCPTQIGTIQDYSAQSRVPKVSSFTVGSEEKCPIQVRFTEVSSSEIGVG
jgi:hypothetical protein